MAKFRNFKPSVEQLTQKRVEMIMQYIIYCYEKMVIDGTKYSKAASYNEKSGKYDLEEYLSEVFVIEYLSLSYNKEHYINSISDTRQVEIIFDNEVKQTYTENGVRKNDFIDIKVSESQIQKIWANHTPNQIHLAIECKRLETGYSEYISDIQKVCNRPHNTPRLPFEGQIGYILNPNYTPQKIKNGINKNLNKQTTIQTTQELKEIALSPSFDASYQSKHKKNYDNSDFTIYHLFLDYNAIVVP